MSRPSRIALLGVSGSGKTTLAREIAGRLGCEHIELDAIHHLADWTPIDRDEMRRIVSDRTAADRWVVDGNYSRMVADIVMARADTVVLLDLPRRVVMWRIVARSLRRLARREELWNGNRERLRYLFKLRPEENIILWAWTTHGQRRESFDAAGADPANAHITWVRITSDRERAAWVDRVAAAHGS